MLLCALLWLGGCSINTYDLGEEVAAWDESRRNVSLTDVLAELGPPLRLSAIPGGHVMAWESWTITEKKLGLSLRAIGADFLSIDFGDAQTEGEFLLLTFDESHQLVDARRDVFAADAGGGQGIQALVSVVSVVDVDDLTRPLPHHRWGGFMLERLPVAQNRESHMDTGSNGIQRRGTPTAVGQHSLELGRSPE